MLWPKSDQEASDRNSVVFIFVFSLMPDSS